MFGFLKKKAVEMNSNISAPVDGEFVAMTEVPDPVFAQMMMGNGFAVKPSNGKIYSPICGTVSSVFPTKHAVGINTQDGKGIIVHMGVDTVSLGGKPFRIHVKEGDVVTQTSKIATVDLDMLARENRDDIIIVAFPEHTSEALHLGKIATVNAGVVVGHF